MASKTTTSTSKKSAPKKTRTVRKETPAPKPSKPVFRTGTWISVILLAALIGGAFYINKNKEAADNVEVTATTEPAFIFSEDSTISSIEIKPTDGETVKVARGADGAWALKLPFETEANQGLVEAAASQVTSLKIISEIVDADPSIFGFDAPAYLITIEFADGKTSTLEVGDATPTNSGYYVRVDKSKMAIVGLSNIDVLASLTFSPPYLNTPTPTALPATPTPEPAPEATVTPTP